MGKTPTTKFRLPLVESLAIQNMDQITQQNASGSQELSATAEELASQAEQLLAAVEYFKVSDSSDDALGKAGVPLLK